MPNYRKYFKNRYRLNGEELENVSIGTSAIGKFEEPLDEAGLHLPFTVRDYEYPMRGLLQILSEDYAGNRIEESYLILSDEVEEGSKYGEWKHNLRVIEYSGKYDSYLYHTFTYTKPLKDNNPAPFKILSNINSEGVNGINYVVRLQPIDIRTSYYVGEPISLPQVYRAVQGTQFVAPNAHTFANVDAIIRVDGGSPHILSNNPLTFSFSTEGQHYIDYGFNAVNSATVPGGGEVVFYRFFVNAITRSGISLLDAINIIRDSKPFESRLYHSQTRLFNIDPQIEPYLASVEMPQMFLQKATMRQILNTMFSYVNAISRFKYNDDTIDTLSMDEFNKIIGEFDLEDLIGYSSSQESVNLFNQGVVWGERVLPSSFEEETITSPSENLYKTVRSTQIQITDTKFGLKLEAELYQPTKFTHKIPVVTLQPQAVGLEPFVYNDYILDLTPRLINREEWLLKEITVNFPQSDVAQMFSENLGLRENRVSNLYWQQGATEINLSEVFGEVYETNLVYNTILEAINEQFTRNMPPPQYRFDAGSGTTVLVTRYVLSTNYYNGSGLFVEKAFKDLQFQLKYITFESFPFQTHRENTTNSLYYTEGRLNQNDKAMNISFASLRAHGDNQRSGVPSIQFQKIYDDYSKILRWGMKDENDYVIVEEKFEFHNEFVKASYIATRDHNRLSLWTKVDQEYRWQEIPTSNQVFERQEIFNENVVITSPDVTLPEEVTMITDNAIELMFGTLMNEWYNDVTQGNTKVTLGYIKTDGFSKIYQDLLTTKNYILTPIRSFGGRHGFSFIFGFLGNQVAGDQVEVKDVSGMDTFWNKAVRYTDENGEFTTLWFAFATKFLEGMYHNDGYTEQERMANYPLTRIINQQYFVPIPNVTHMSGLSDFNSMQYNGLMFGKKDKSQSIKVAIQNSVIPYDYREYVLGISFFTNNFLVSNPEKEFDTTIGTAMFLYLYTNPNIKYDKFSVHKIKSGWVTSTFLQNGENVSFFANQFRFSGEISLLNVTAWAIGDGLGNLYMACNQPYNGFNVTRRHFYPNQEVIGSDKKIFGDLFTNLSSGINVFSNLLVQGFVYPKLNIATPTQVGSSWTAIFQSTDYKKAMTTYFSLGSTIGSILRFEDFLFELEESFQVNSEYTQIIKSTNFVESENTAMIVASDGTVSPFTFPRISINQTVILSSSFTAVIKSTDEIEEPFSAFNVSSELSASKFEFPIIEDLSDDLSVSSELQASKFEFPIISSMGETITLSSTIFDVIQSTDEVDEDYQSSFIVSSTISSIVQYDPKDEFTSLSSPLAVSSTMTVTPQYQMVWVYLGDDSSNDPNVDDTTFLSSGEVANSFDMNQVRAWLEENEPANDNPYIIMGVFNEDMQLYNIFQSVVA